MIDMAYYIHMQGPRKQQTMANGGDVPHANASKLSFAGMGKECKVYLLTCAGYWLLVGKCCVKRRRVAIFLVFYTYKTFTNTCTPITPPLYLFHKRKKKMKRNVSALLIVL